MQPITYSMLGRLALRMFSLTVMLFMLSCAAIIPDWNTREVNNTSDKPRVQVVISPLGPNLCDKGINTETGTHYVSVNIVLSQHNQEYQETFIADNYVGARFEPHQSVSARIDAGVGDHTLRYGTYIYDEDGEVELTWQGEHKYTVRCCHEPHKSDQRIAR